MESRVQMVGGLLRYTGLVQRCGIRGVSFLPCREQRIWVGMTKLEGR